MPTLTVGSGSSDIVRPMAVATEEYRLFINGDGGPPKPFNPFGL